MKKRDVVKQVSKSINSKQSYEDQKKLKSLNNKLSKIESKINQLEKEIKTHDIDLETNYDKTVADPKFFELYQAKKDSLNTLMKDWETTQEALDLITS